MAEGRRATIKAHPTLPNLPRPYGKGFIWKDGEPEQVVS